MKLVWSPEIAAKAFMDTVKSVSPLIIHPILGVSAN